MRSAALQAPAPPDLLIEPVGYGYQDVAVPRLRVYYPSLAGGVRDAAPLAPFSTRRPYRIVLFIHGQRSTSDNLCPSGTTLDYARWDTVLPLLARCGLVVVSVDVQATIGFDPTAAAAAAVNALSWVRGRWEHAAIVREPPVVVDPDRPRPLPNVAAVGHSWGAKAAARLAAERRVRCVAGISGTWDDTAGGSPDLRRARVPALLIGAMEDTTISAHPTNQPFCEQVPPIHQASLLGIGHWDLSEIAACGDPRPAPARGSRVIASEMLTVFMHRYLYSNSRLSPQLIGPAGGRPSLRPFLTREGGCAVRLRYRDPFTEPGKLRAFGYGHWPRELDAWRDC